MTEVYLPVPALTGGITQNPAETAEPGRILDSLNQVPIPKSGMARRSGSTFRALVNADTALETSLIPVDFGGDDRFIAAVSHDQVKVFRRNGTEIPIWGVTRDSDGVITGGTAPDFSYINLRAPNELLTVDGDDDLAESFEVAALKWLISGSAAASGIGAGPASPLGWPANSSHAGQDNYAELKITAGGTAGRYRHNGFNGHMWTKKWGIYVRVNLTVAGVGTLILPDSVSLILQDPADLHASTERTVTWDLNADPTAIPTVSANTENYKTFQQRIPGTTEEYILGFVFDPDRVLGGPTGTGNTIYAFFEILDDGAPGADPAGLNVWGMQVIPDPDDDTLPRYGLEPESLRHVSAGATTFVTNPSIPTRLDTTVTSKTFTEVYPDRLFDLEPGPGTASRAVGSAGYVFFKQGLADSATATILCTVEVLVKNTVGAGGTITLTSAYSLGSTVIAATTHAAALNADVLNVNIAGTEVALQATAYGSILMLETQWLPATPEKWEILEIRVHDAQGDQLQSGYTNQVDDISDLPKRGPARHGHVVKLVEVSDDKDDFQIPQVILRFVADDPTDGTFGAGRWEEGVDYGLRTTLDATTLPHILTRRSDNAGTGVVTGLDRETYFEWGPHTWDTRVVGDNVTNPPPSFVTPEADEGLVDQYVDAIGFFGNRLILGSGLGLAMSEVSLYGNFWRTSLRVLPNSDRIDIILSVPDVARIRDIGVAAGRLFVRTNRAFQVITSSGALSPRTVGVETAYGGGSDPVAQSATAAGGIFIPGDGSDNGGVVFVFPAGSADQLAFDSLETTEDVPYLINKEIHTLVWASALSSLFVHSREDPTKLYGLRFSSTAQQLAWFPLDFNGADVHSVCVLAGELFVVVARESGTELERLQLDEIQRDPEMPWRVCLDRRISEQDLLVPMTYSAPDTTITLPYTITPGADYFVVPRNGADFGVKHEVVSATGSTVTVTGNLVNNGLYMGEAFTSYVKPLPPVVRDLSATGVNITRAASPILARECAVALADSGHAEYVVTDPNGVEQTSSFDGESGGFATASAGDGAEVTVGARTDRFGLAQRADEVDVTIRTSEQKPMTLVGLEWLLDVNDRAQRIV